jgi:hypothetical protein
MLLVGKVNALDQKHDETSHKISNKTTFAVLVLENHHVFQSDKFRSIIYLIKQSKG